MKIKFGLTAIFTRCFCCVICAFMFFSCDFFDFLFEGDEDSGNPSLPGNGNGEDEHNYYPQDVLFFDFNDGAWEGWETSKDTTAGPLPQIIYEDAVHGNVVAFDARDSRVGQRAAISNTFILQEKTELRFLIKSDIHSESALVLYINDVQTASYSGTNRPWVLESFILNAGTHKISFTMERESNRYMTSGTNSARLDNIVLRSAQTTRTFIEDFELASNAAFNASFWYGGAVLTTAAAEASEDQYFGNSTKFIKLPRVSNGSTVLRSRINPSQPSALTFTFRAAIRSDIEQNFKVYVNDEEKGSYANERADSVWRTESILLAPGEQLITFEMSSANRTSGTLNAVYIDNIGLVPDVTDSVALYPRGNLNTYVGAPENERIKFRAQALRSDGSVRQNASGFVFSGAGVNSSTGVFAPSSDGTLTVNVSIDGKSASRSVTVHPENYLRLPYTYPGTGKTYNGFSGTQGNRATSGGVTVTYPSETAFSADGFITVEGTVNNSTVENYAYIRVFKNDDQNNTLTTYYVKDKFKQRIWLRSGQGVYTVNVHGLTRLTLSSEGIISNISYSGSPVSFTVTNTANDGMSADGITPDKRFLYPSYIIQSDDFRITNLAADLTFNLTDDTAKIKAIHDYIVANTFYDYFSADSEEGVRRKQDALSVLETRFNVGSPMYPAGHLFAVCEGYTNAFAALARAAGYETRYVSSILKNHAWNHIYTGGRWKFMDVTWNDPSSNKTDLGPLSVRYNYFLLNSLTGADGSHSENDAVVNNNRSVVTAPSVHMWDGYEGWY